MNSPLGNLKMLKGRAGLAQLTLESTKKLVEKEPKDSPDLPVMKANLIKVAKNAKLTEALYKVTREEVREGNKIEKAKQKKAAKEQLSQKVH